MAFSFMETVMSDKKEIATLSIKISVNSTDLDKLEAQLKRIAGLMVSTGLKEPAKGGFVIDPYFGVNDGQVFINSVFITSTTISDAMQKAAKEGARRGAEQTRFEITTGVSHNNEILIAKDTLKPSTAAIRLDKTTSREESEFDKLKQRVEANFSQLQSHIIGLECASVASEQVMAQHLTRLQREVASISEVAETAKAQEEALIAAVKKTITEDIARGGQMFRGLR